MIITGRTVLELPRNLLATATRAIQLPAIALAGEPSPPPAPFLLVVTRL